MINQIMILLIFISYNALSCEYQDITETTMTSVRQKLISNQDNSGHRISFIDFKKKNKKHGGGSVDDAVAGFVDGLCDQFKSLENDNKVKFVIKKTDFKGFFIECSPREICDSIDDKLANRIKNLKRPKITTIEIDEKTKKKKVTIEGEIDLRGAKGKNYTDGYVRARVSEAYPNFKNTENVAEFLDKQLTEGLQEAFEFDRSKEKILSKAKKELIEKAMDDWRSGRDDLVPEKYKKLIVAIDAMETPFPGSDNFEKALVKATTITAEDIKKSKGKYILKKAKSGDDIMFVIIKDGEIKKIVGADAKGLGVLNLSTRLDSYINSIGSMDSIDDITAIGEIGTNSANIKMADSMELYEEKLRTELKKSNSSNLEIKVSKANKRYKDQQGLNKQNIMEMRAGYIEGCFDSAGCIQDEITAIHNKLKVLEEHGYNGYLGDSCLGVEYRLRKLGIGTHKK